MPLKMRWNVDIRSNVCPECEDLHGEEWVFYLERDMFPDFLTHPMYNNVWDCHADASMAHPNCRCKIEKTFTDEELQQKIKPVTTRMEALKTSLEAHTI